MRARGFTLIELLIALVVVAVAGTMVSSAVSSIADQTYLLERRTIAHWAAQNHLAAWRIEAASNDQAIAEGKHADRVLMSDRQWMLRTEVKSTSHPWLRRLEVEVFEVVGSEEVGPIVTTAAFVGRY